MSLFDWRPEYSVSIQRFDCDHKKLISLLNELNDAMAEKRGRLVVGHLLRDLADYSCSHFAAEEEAMCRASYPGLSTHAAEHREFAKKLAEIQYEYAAGSSAVTIDLLYFLRDWVQRHILESDHKYGTSLNQAGIY